jgi:hypothetical protein
LFSEAGAMRALDITALTIPLPASRAKNSSTYMAIVVVGGAGGYE